MGVAHQVDAVTRRDGVYGRVLAALDTRARVDIIAGTSAGGINGAALACTQVRGQDGAPFDDLLDTWSREGALRRLVTPPGTPEPRSVLRGDAVFLPRLQEAFHRLLPGLKVGQMYGPADRPLRLRLTTTLLDPVLTTSQDSLGTNFVQEQHQGRFTFARPWAAGDGRDDHFAPAAPENEDLEIDPPRRDMAPYANFPASRWVVDGGVLMNTPLPLVLDDIAAAPAHLQTRRILLLVVPDPIDPMAVENTPDRRDKPVNVRETLTECCQEFSGEVHRRRLR